MFDGDHPSGSQFDPGPKTQIRSIKRSLMPQMLKNYETLTYIYIYIWVYIIKSCISGFSCQRIKHVVWHTCRVTCLTFTSSNQWIIQWIPPSIHLERWKTSYRSTNKTNWFFHSIPICSRVPSIEVFFNTICIYMFGEIPMFLAQLAGENGEIPMRFFTAAPSSSVLIITKLWVYS